MGIFGTYDIAATGLYANRKWMDAISDNISNMNDTVSPSQQGYREEFINVSAANYGQVGGGTQVTGVSYGSSQGELVSDPDSPLAQKGMVKKPSIDLGDQMTYLIEAQRSYQANLAVVDRATAAYQAALNLKGS